MSTRFRNYVVRQLAATGIAVVEPAIAFYLAPDDWPGPHVAAAEFPKGADVEKLLTSLLGLVRFRAEAAAIGDPRQRPVMIVARTTNESAISERLEVLGVSATKLQRVTSFTEPQSAAVRLGAPLPGYVHGQDLAPEDEAAPPPQQCEARTRWYAKRGLPDPDLEHVRRQRAAERG